MLKALAGPARLRLLSLIQSAPDGEASVSDLTAPLELSQPTVSHYLRICAPEEPRRPSSHELITRLLYAPTVTPSGLRNLAVRVGVLR